MCVRRACPRLIASHIRCLHFLRSPAALCCCQPSLRSRLCGERSAPCHSPSPLFNNSSAARRCLRRSRPDRGGEEKRCFCLPSSPPSATCTSLPAWVLPRDPGCCRPFTAARRRHRRARPRARAEISRAAPRRRRWSPAWLQISSGLRRTTTDCESHPVTRPGKILPSAHDFTRCNRLIKPNKSGSLSRAGLSRSGPQHPASHHSPKPRVCTPPTHIYANESLLRRKRCERPGTVSLRITAAVSERRRVEEEQVT